MKKYFSRIILFFFCFNFSLVCFAQGEEVLDFVEEEAQFPGGQSEMYKFLSRNIIYPDISKEAGVQGKVYVQFDIGKTGEISNVKVLRGVSADIDQEAIRVVKLMPRWIPGKQSGKPVNSRYIVPISFKLS